MKAKTDTERLLHESLTAFSQWYAPSLELGRAVWTDAWRAWEDAAKGVAARSCGCRVPERPCPPRCVCELSWDATVGRVLRGSVRVTNTGRAARDFVASATNLVAPDHDPDVTPALEPAQFALEPGRSQLVTVSLTGTERLQPGRTYAAEVRIAGLYEQCVALRVVPRPEPRPHCDVEQGEIPTRIRAHRWSDHFQCEEPCFEPVRPRPEGGRSDR